MKCFFHIQQTSYKYAIGYGGTIDIEKKQAGLMAAATIQFNTTVSTVIVRP